MLSGVGSEQLFSNYRFFIPMIVQNAFPEDPEKSARFSSKLLKILDQLDEQDIKSKVSPYIPQVIQLFNSKKYKELVELLGGALDIDIKSLTEEMGDSSIIGQKPVITRKKVF